MPADYHRLAAIPGNRWWRPVVGTLYIVVAGAELAIGLILVVMAVALAAGRPRDADGLPDVGTHAELALTFLGISALLPVTLVAARCIQGRPAGTLSSVEGRLRWRWLLLCLGVAAVAVVLVLGLAALVTPADGDYALVGWRSFLGTAILLLLVVPPQAAAEEYFTRGWLLQAVGAYCRRPWLPIAVQAIVFASLHGWGTPWGFADLIVFGMVAGWLTVRTGGLEAAIALHVANNVIGSLLATAFGDFSTDQTAADLPWQIVAIDVPVLIAYAGMVLWLKNVRSAPGTARWRPVRSRPR